MFRLFPNSLMARSGRVLIAVATVCALLLIGSGGVGHLSGQLSANEKWPCMRPLTLLGL